MKILVVEDESTIAEPLVAGLEREGFEVEWAANGEQALAAEPGAAVTRRSLFENVWQSHWFGSTKTIDVHVASLRRKLGDPGWIETVRGVGFRLRAPE
jgi:DNA-binding response OmpR family regulator